MSRFQSLVRMDTPLGQAITMMGSSPRNKQIAGIAVVVDDAQRVVGVVTDGDVRRGLSQGVALADPVSAVANRNPFTIDCALPPTLMREAVLAEARRRNSHYLKYDKLILIERDRTFYDVILVTELFHPRLEDKRIAVYGMGFVGLTLACTFANAGFPVVGIDTNSRLIEGLKDGIAPFYEKGLDSMLSSLESTNPILFTSDVAESASEADIHVVSVGSPIGPDGTPDLGDVKAAAELIARRLKYDDLVVFRSTVPVGTMRRVVLPVLEQSGLACGRDFHLVFAPERAIEGNALEELRTLPQVIGGFNRAGASVAARLFSHITPTVIEVETLEEAELVKLMNNSFRDLVFSFANEAAYVCDSFNINAFNVIRAANEGYPRDRIPLPSPGVGGTCLSKDPHLYANPLATNSYRPTLGLASRGINGEGADYVLGKLHAFAEAVDRRIEDLTIMIVGLAFKGMPETSDIRASTALEVLERLPDRSKIRVKDFVVPAKVIAQLGCTAVEEDLGPALKGADAVLVMNNHYRNNRFNVVQALRQCKGPMLLFDGWNMFDQREIESLGHVTYATMGYMTPGPRTRA